MATGKSPASRGPAESRLPTALRDLVDRVRHLENRRFVTVGSWRVQENTDGDLVAYNPTTDETVVLDGSGSGVCDCEDGVDGVDGLNGTDGIDGVDGTDGTDGVDGTDGTDGIDGTDGTDGTDGVDGVDGLDGPGAVPTLLETPDIFTVYANKQMLFREEIVLEAGSEITIGSNAALIGV